MRSPCSSISGMLSTAACRDARPYRSCAVGCVGGTGPVHRSVHRVYRWSVLTGLRFAVPVVLVALIVVALIVVQPTSPAASAAPIDMHRAHESSERADRGPMRAVWRKRWVECREVLWLRNRSTTSGLRHSWRRGSYKDARACRSRWRSLAKGDTLLAIRWVFPRGQWAAADAITECEGGASRRVDAVGDGGSSRSAWQISSRYWRYNHAKALTNALYSARLAHSIWRQRGWQPWTCARILGIRS